MDRMDIDENQYFLDTKTGDIFVIDDEFFDEEEDDDLPEWQLKERERALVVRNDTEGRFIDIPENDRREGYRLMENFIDSVRDERPRHLLTRAITGKGSFRRFKDTLEEFPVLRQQWFEFEAQRKRERAEEWLESIDLISSWTPPKRKPS
jgi:hypothetical protein